MVNDSPLAPFTIIVNTSDAYADCWEPFFTLFRKYWPDSTAPILLNTERRDCIIPGVDARATRVQEGIVERLSWSDCLLACLRMVETPLVLYLQEDYFLEGRVLDSKIRALSALMMEDPAIRHIGLTSFGARGPFTPARHRGLWTIARRSAYRISCQAALWRVETLRSYLRPGESGWMFELYGTRRARRRDELFLTVDRDENLIRPVFPYSHAGIIKGRWHESVPALFERHGIEMDFSRRGFFRRKPRLFERMQTFAKLLERPGSIVGGLAGR